MSDASTPSPVTVLTRSPRDVARGVAIGAVEIVPGVSGGTVALVVGVYETLIASAGHVVQALRLLVTGKVTQARAEAAQARWSVVVPVLVGMILAVAVAPLVLGPLLEDHPTGSRAVFLGLVAASIVVPARMLGVWSPRLVALAAVAALAAFGLTGLSRGPIEDPALPLVAAVAAVAICALVMPGVSGAFLLVAVGLYDPTIQALADRDLVYIATFALGAAIGLGTFVRVLQYLLEHRRQVTLAVMTGLMTGSLRALWPWQTDDRTAIGPDGDLLVVSGLVLAGATLVGLLVVVQARAEREASPAA